MIDWIALISKLRHKSTFGWFVMHQTVLDVFKLVVLAFLGRTGLTMLYCLPSALVNLKAWMLCYCSATSGWERTGA